MPDEDAVFSEITLRNFRRHYLNEWAPPEIPEWQVQIIQAMIEGRTLIVSRAGSQGLRQLFEYLESIGFAGDARIIERDIVPETSVMITDDLSNETNLSPEATQRLTELRQRWFDELYANTPPDPPFRRLIEAGDGRRPSEPRVPDELNTTPEPDHGQDAGPAMSSDELLEAIGAAVDEWKDVRDV